MANQSSSKDKLPDCCKPHKKGDGVKEGVLYGLVPHIGCIGFIIFSILGVTAATAVFKPLLLNPYFFHVLIGLSMVFATASAALYLKQHNMLGWNGIKAKRRYLAVMYGTTLAVNLLLFMFVFPYVANFTFKPTMAAVAAIPLNTSSTMAIAVDIPCPGHAPLIVGELQALDGITDVKFVFPNKFTIQYDSAKVAKSGILALEVFKSYPAKII